MTTLVDPPPAMPAAAPLSPTPNPAPLPGHWAWLEPWIRPAFISLNHRLMIPLHHAGLAAWLATPIGGYLLLLRVRGRRSGLVREMPLSYLVADGAVWLLAGFGTGTQWYRNLLADPHVEVWLPGRRFAAVAEPAGDQAVRARILPQLARAAGLPGFTIGCNPWTAADDEIVAALDWVPLVRIVPDPGPVEAGADDPGGHAWIWRQALLIGVGLAVLRAVRSLAGVRGQATG